MTWTERRAAWAVLVVGGLGFVLVAAWLVPWHPVPGGLPDPVSAESVLAADQIARAEDYSSLARWWSWSSLALSLLVAGLLGFTRAGRAVVRRLPGPWPVRVVLAVAFCEVAGRLATLPLGIGLHQLQVDAGLATQGWLAWLRDVAVGQLLTIAVTGAVLVVVVACARRWRRAWPAVVGGSLGALVLLGSLAYPVVVEPLFNEFTPLPDGSLRNEILAAAQLEGVTVDEVLVADASRRTTTLNAYVSGFGSTRRVVLYDNLVDQAPGDQVLSVVAHELAHARYDDVLVGSVLGALAAMAGAGALGLLVARGRRAEGAVVLGPEDVPRVLALVAVAVLVTSPVQATISRLVETRADVTALETTGDPVAFVELQRSLAVRSLADPTPPAWSQLWFGTHPTLVERVALARGWEAPGISSRQR
ncbi:M48 family metalloprotease [Nocardioides euryhalodurans]|uniref:M48 family peptidase n=1 Tax=Nocardioides euryhalodurans TaxID=2518370 RepID=A0A4P7GPM8_9ACTN|nr:M48 family metalloprotease [Nocardioides euryhalodurans]QBR94195.1 M48 family peptidase [Nocardioides euryhalodurans]